MLGRSFKLRQYPAPTMLETSRQFGIVAGNDRHFPGLHERSQAD
jgi:hypothetical protein